MFFQFFLHQIILIGLYCLVVNSNPYVAQHSYYRQTPAFYHPQDNYFVSQSRQMQSYAMPKWSSSNQKRTIQRPQGPYRVWSYQHKNVHRWPALSNAYYNDYNQQVQSESYNRPIYRRQNHIKKSSTGPVSYNKKIDFLESKKKKSQPVCKTQGETCYGWEPYIPENCCKGYVCDHDTKGIVGVCLKRKSPIKPMSSKQQSNMVQRPLTTEELLAGV